MDSSIPSPDLSANGGHNSSAQPIAKRPYECAVLAPRFHRDASPLSISSPADLIETPNGSHRCHPMLLGRNHRRLPTFQLLSATKDRRVNICRIVAFRSAKAAFFRRAKGDTYFCVGPNGLNQP